MTLCVVCDGRGFTLLRPVEGIETLSIFVPITSTKSFTLLRPVEGIETQYDNMSN